MRRVAAMAALVLTLACCGRPAAIPTGMARVTIHAAGGDRQFVVDVAATAERQQRGLMGRTSLPPDGGMLFAPYPPGGGAPARAVLWMKDTPLPLDIVFIAPDRTIDSIAASARPNDETMLPSNGSVSAVLEIAGGRTAALGIRAGDRVEWEEGR